MKSRRRVFFEFVAVTSIALFLGLLGGASIFSVLNILWNSL